MKEIFHCLLFYFFFSNENSVPLYSHAVLVKFCQRSENNSLKKNKDKGKVLPRTGHEGPEGE
jgi:hypothetical protein